MRAKNEFKFIAEAYNTKLILERVVDGKLMCPEACCGSPVMECKCGPDCPHCNCHEIQKLAKEEDNEGAAGHLRRAAARGAVRHDDDSDAALWKKQMKHQPDVSPEEVERLKNRKPKPQSYSKKHPKREDNEELQVQVGSQVMWDRQRQHGIVDELDDPENPTVAFVLDDDGGESIVDVENIDVISGPIEDNEEPKRGITGYQHTDALAQAALSKDYKHKPYVSSFVGDGGKKIFAILGSDGKIVHKTHDKREAHQWLKDNYENI